MAGLAFPGAVPGGDEIDEALLVCHLILAAIVERLLMTISRSQTFETAW